MKAIGYTLLGMVPVGLVFGLVYVLYPLAGSMDKLVAWLFVGIMGSIISTLALLGIHELGKSIWRSLDIPHKLHIQKLHRQRAKAAKAAVKKQDGQLSNTNAAQGQLSRYVHEMNSTCRGCDQCP